MRAKYLTASDAGRALGLTPGAVRMMERRGDLKAAQQTEGGVRLFLRSEVDRVRKARRKRTGRQPAKQPASRPDNRTGAPDEREQLARP